MIDSMSQCAEKETLQNIDIGRMYKMMKELTSQKTCSSTGCIKSKNKIFNKKRKRKKTLKMKCIHWRTFSQRVDKRFKKKKKGSNIKI